MNRTLQLHGIGYHDQSCEISVKFKDQPIFQGAVNTETQRFFNAQGTTSVSPFNSLVHSWQVPLDAQEGLLEIRALKGDFLFTRLLSNFMPVTLASDGVTVTTSGETGFIPCYAAPVSGGILRDPNFNVTINGVSRVREPVTAHQQFGQWFWGIQEGSTFVSTARVSAGLASPNLLDGNTVLATINVTGDGTTVDYALPAYAGLEFYTIEVTVNGASSTTHSLVYNPVDKRQNVRFASPPAPGAIVAVRLIQSWDGSLATYLGFEAELDRTDFRA